MRNVAIELQHSQWALMMSVAQILRDQHGFNIFFYCRTQMDLQFFKSKFEGPVEFSVNGRPLNSLENTVIDRDLVFEKARLWEERTGTTINRMTFCERHLSLGYAGLATRFPRRPDFQACSYEQLVNSVVDGLEFWEQEIESKSLSLMLECGHLASLVAIYRNVAYRHLVLTRLGNLQYWATDEHHSMAGLDRKLALALDADEATGSYKGGMYYPASKSKDGLVQNRRYLPKALWASIKAPIGYIRAKRHSIRRPLREGLLSRIVSPIDNWRLQRKIRKQFSSDPRALRLPYIYYPLHKEPETAYFMRSPDVFDQLAVILALARDLPAGHLLAIKENLHAVGRRSPDFYRQLDDLKNVVCLDIDADPVSCIENSEAVATVAGTAGLEASLMGKPAIVFSPHTTYKNLPNVRFCQYLGDLRDDVNWVLSAKDRVGEFANAAFQLSKVLEDCSFPADSFRVLRDKKRGASHEIAQRATVSLMQSLEDERLDGLSYASVCA